jgi:hypothetical protein
MQQELNSTVAYERHMQQLHRQLKNKDAATKEMLQRKDGEHAAAVEEKEVEHAHAMGAIRRAHAMVLKEVAQAKKPEHWQMPATAVTTVDMPKNTFHSLEQEPEYWSLCSGNRIDETTTFDKYAEVASLEDALKSFVTSAAGDNNDTSGASVDTGDYSNSNSIVSGSASTAFPHGTTQPVIIASASMALGLSGEVPEKHIPIDFDFRVYLQLLAKTSEEEGDDRVIIKRLQFLCAMIEAEGQQGR